MSALWEMFSILSGVRRAMRSACVLCAADVPVSANAKIEVCSGASAHLQDPLRWLEDCSLNGGEIVRFHQILLISPRDERPPAILYDQEISRKGGYCIKTKPTGTGSKEVGLTDSSQVQHVLKFI